ncbi:hypothetical protein PMAYCL1PPCAC_30441, partial [Pristionchus mayeri]
SFFSLSSSLKHVRTSEGTPRSGQLFQMMCSTSSVSYPSVTVRLVTVINFSNSLLAVALTVSAPYTVSCVAASGQYCSHFF